MRPRSQPGVRVLALLVTGLAVGGCLLATPLSELAEECNATSCVALHARSASCVAGACVLDCEPLWASCNGDGKDGCEQSLEDPASCGRCGARCVATNATSATCSGGTCVLGCFPGFVDCNASGADGCEADIANDLRTCGGCGKLCAAVNGTAACVGGRCDLECRPPFLDCDGDPANGCEVDGSIDRGNCAGCGQTCEGSCAFACRPLTLTTGQPSPSELVVAGTMAYWSYPNTTHGGVAQVPIHGGASTAMCVSPNASAPKHLALSPTALYWFDESGSTIYSAPLPNGGAASLVIGAQTAGGIAADAAGVFWSDTASKEIRRLDGPSFVTVASSTTDGVGKIALDANNVYFVAPLTHKLFKVPRTGGAPVLLFDATSSRTIDAVALDAATVYFATSDAAGAHMWSIRKDGGSLTPLFGMAKTSNLVTDGTFLFFTDTVGGIVFRGRTSGEVSVRVLVDGQAKPWGIAVDEKSVYWTNLGDGPNVGTVSKLEKRPDGT